MGVNWIGEKSLTIARWELDRREEFNHRSVGTGQERRVLSYVGGNWIGETSLIIRRWELDRRDESYHRSVGTGQERRVLSYVGGNWIGETEAGNRVMTTGWC